MSTKSREVIYGGRLIGAKIRAADAREAAQKAVRKADRAEAEQHGRSKWKRMEDPLSPLRPSVNVSMAGWGWLEVECNRCKTRASILLDAIRRPRDTPIWKPEAARKCRSCRKGRYAPPVHMVKLTQKQEITRYKWVHPDDDDRR